MADSNSPLKGELKRLRDVCRIVSGGTPSKANSAYWSGTIPWVTARDLKSFDVKSSTFKLTPLGASRLPLAPAGSVLVLVRGMQLLKSFPVAFLKVDSTFNQDVRALMPGEAMRGRYLAWQLCARESQILRLVDIAGHGTGRLSGDLLRDIRVTVPPLDAQDHAIVSLDSLDAAQRAVGELVLVKRQFRSGLLQALLTGQRRFPEFAATPWRKRALSDLLHGVSRPVEWSDDTEYNLLSLRRRSGGTFLRERRPGAQIKSKSLFTVDAGDFLISRMQVAHGALALVRPEHAGMCVSATYDVLRARDAAELDIRFFDYLSRLPMMYRKVRLACHGVHVEKMTFNLDQFLRTVIDFPVDLAEQQRIADLLDSMDEEGRLLQATVDALRQQKLALMDRLLGGVIT